MGEPVAPVTSFQLLSQGLCRGDPSHNDGSEGPAESVVPASGPLPRGPGGPKARASWPPRCPF